MNVDGVAALAKQENVYKRTYKRAYISLCLYATSYHGGGVTYLKYTKRTISQSSAVHCKL